MSLKDGLNYIDAIKAVVSVNCDMLPETDKYEFVETVNLKTDGNLYVRNKKDGDKMIQGKMTKKLKTIFCDKHIPSHYRDKIPVICDEKGILYIPTVATRDGAKSKKGQTLIKVYKLKEKLNA